MDDDSPPPADDSTPRILFTGYPRTVVKRLTAVSSFQGLFFLWIICLQGQGHSEGSNDQNMTLSTIFSELLFPWQPNLVLWYITLTQSVM